MFDTDVRKQTALGDVTKSRHGLDILRETPGIYFFLSVSLDPLKIVAALCVFGTRFVFLFFLNIETNVIL